MLTSCGDHWVDSDASGCFYGSRHTIQSLSALQFDGLESLSARTKKTKIFPMIFHHFSSFLMDFMNMKSRISIDFLIKIVFLMILYMNKLPGCFLWLRGLTNNVLSDAKWIYNHINQ